MGQCHQHPIQVQFDHSKFKPNQFKNHPTQQTIKSPTKQQPKTNSFEKKKPKVNINAPDPQFAVQLTDQEIRLSEAAKNRLRQLGEFSYPDKKFYTGEKLGLYKLNNGVIYDGEWENRIMNGKGKYYLPGGSLLQTVTKHGKVTGKSRMIKINGDYYEGQIFESQANGKGVYVEQDVKYEGDFKNNLKHGYGQQKSVANNYHFKGMFVNGQKTNGVLKWGKDYDNQYEGELKDDKPHKWGKLKKQLGIYEGEFIDGMKFGAGKFVWKDGHVYMGQYENDAKNGKGSLFTPQGKEVKKCMWKNDLPIN